MKYFGKAYLVACVLGIAAIIFFGLGYDLAAAILCVPSFLMIAGEVKKYATFFQFVGFRVVSLVLGFSLDRLIGDSQNLYTLCMFVMSFAGLVRLELYKVFLINRLGWMEPLGLTGMYAIYIYAGLTHPADWRGWAIPALPIALMTYIGTSITLATLKTNKTVKDRKYNAELGQTAPSFSLPDHEGTLVDLETFKNKNHVLLVFVRGDWCPTCHMMIRTYEKNRDKFLEKEVVAIGIGPDATEVNKEMISRLGWKNMLLSDHTQEVTRKYGIGFYENNPETKYPEGVPLPASFLIDKSGVIRYVSRPDKIGEFLNPTMIFPILEKLN